MRVIVSSIVLVFISISIFSKGKSPSDPYRRFIPRVENLSNVSGLNKLQWEQLRFVYFSNNPLPRKVSVEELNRVESILANEGNREEVKILSYVFRKNLELMALALRDSDQDGIRDYKVSEYYGKFFEYDLDVDGDGILNVYDERPYQSNKGGVDLDGDGIPDKNFKDSDSDGIPNHVDFSLLGYDKKSSKLQRSIFNNFKILTIERSHKFAKSFLQSTFDGLNIVFKSFFKKFGEIRTLSVIASEKSNTIIDDGTFGLEYPETKTVTFYKSGQKLPILLQLGLITHEVSHAIQVLEDVEKNGNFNLQVTGEVENIVRKLEVLGWSGFETWTKSPPERIYAEFMYEYLDKRMGSFLSFKNKSIAKWSKEILHSYNLLGAPAYLATPGFRQAGVVSDYSMSDPFEFLSENHNAYLNYSIERHVLKQKGPLAVKKFRKNGREGGWQYTRYENFKLHSFFREYAPISYNDSKSLYKRYAAPFLK